MNNFKFCIKCGKKIPKNTIFCPYCGHKQPNITNTKSKTATKRSLYSTKRHSNHRYSSHKLWLLIIIILVVIVGGFGFYKHKEDTSLSHILTSHSWTAKFTNLDSNNRSENHNLTFKNGKIYRQKKVFASYNVASQNRINMYVYSLHEHVYTHVKSSNPNKIIINKEYSKLSPAFAKQIRNSYNAAPHKPHLLEYERKAMNGQMFKDQEISEFVK